MSKFSEFEAGMWQDRLRRSTPYQAIASRVSVAGRDDISAVTKLSRCHLGLHLKAFGVAAATFCRSKPLHFTLALTMACFVTSCGVPPQEFEPITIERSSNEPAAEKATEEKPTPIQSATPNQSAPAATTQSSTPLPAANVIPLEDQDFLGLRWTPEKSVFRVFAPTATRVTLHLFPSADGADSSAQHDLTEEADDIWEVVVDGNLEGQFYAYQLEGAGLNPEQFAVDLYATNTVNSGTRARITDLDKTNPPNWDQLKVAPELKSPVDAVIYELHIRDLTSSPTSGVSKGIGYLGWTEGGTRLPSHDNITTALDHMQELGVTHVQILPVHDFENDETAGQFNWGYMTNGFFSPEGMYASNISDDSRIRELKQLIAALHQRGIGVILDVVYNHTGNHAEFNKFAPNYYYRQYDDGRYSNGSGCGNDFRTESKMGRRLIVDSVKYWVEEYGVSGFRFDLMALMDTGTMRMIEDELYELNPDIILYGEPWTSGHTPMKGSPLDKNNLKSVGIGAFNDDFRNALKGYPDGDGPGFIQNDTGKLNALIDGIAAQTPWIPAPAQSINYMTCHDNLVLFDKIEISRPKATEREIVDMMHLGYLTLFAAQGVPFIHAGEEFARHKDGHHNSYNAPDTVNQIDWSLKKKHFQLFQDVQSLIALRKAHPLFRLRSPRQIEDRVEVSRKYSQGRQLMWTIDGTDIAGESWSRACILLNADDQGSASFELPPGDWQIGYQSGEARRQPTLRAGSCKVPASSGTILFLP